MNRTIELLSPAKNLECGMEAVNHGADAVYIGASKFGARANAGNSVQEIEALVKYAHPFGVRIFTTLNTILFDHEMEEVEKLIWNLYDIGVDAIILQDLGVLNLNLPPIELHASTQTDNQTIEKIQFLEKCGFSRVVLARELSLSEIQSIRKETSCELEAFVHGSLCVSYSGRCYMSQALCGRSANRGECAQYCRLPYSLQDADGTILVKNKNLLSLKDLNQSLFLKELLEAGISSFKIEGRLKDVNYVKNITAYYRQKLDTILEGSEYKRSSYGKSTYFFTPNSEKSFHRGNSNYFLHQRTKGLVQPDTPKSMGEYLGKISAVFSNAFQIETDKTVHNGDGLCFSTSEGDCSGFGVNRSNEKIVPSKMPKLAIGTKIYRNFDHEFEKILQRKSAERTIEVNAFIKETEHRVEITLVDEEGISVTERFESEKQPAQKAEQAYETIQTQISKLGDTIFKMKNVEIDFPTPYFFPSSCLANWRKRVVQQLLEKRAKIHSPIAKKRIEKEAKTTFSVDYTANIANKNAQTFYAQHGTEIQAPAFELKEPEYATLMTCKYCIKYEMGWCLKQKGAKAIKEPLFLNYKNNLFKLTFDCKQCEMRIEK